MARMVPVDVSSLDDDGVSNFGALFLDPVRIFILGPHRELGEMKRIPKLFLRNVKYSIDYVQADWRRQICNKAGAI